jgi:hypothetical protein
MRKCRNQGHLKYSKKFCQCIFLSVAVQQSIGCPFMKNYQSRLAELQGGYFLAMWEMNRLP